MSAPAFTPGPWQYLRSPSGPIRVGPSHNCTVAVAPFPPAGDQEANVRLIAAAPELFEALDEMLREFGVDGHGAEFKDGECRVVDRARAALAAATGERP